MMSSENLTRTNALLTVGSLENLHRRTSTKWREFPAEVLPMHVAEMDYEIALRIREKLASMIAGSDTGYLGPMPELALSMAGFAIHTKGCASGAWSYFWVALPTW